MLLNEINTYFETHKVLQYGADGNKGVRHNVDMQLIEGNLYKGKNIQESGCNYETCTVFAFYPEYDIGIELRSFSTDIEVDEIIKQFKNSALESAETFIRGMDSLAENGGFIGAIHIELAKYIKPENVSKYQVAKAEFHKKKETECQKKAEQRDEEDRLYCEERNKIAEAKIADTIEKFKNNGEIQNITVDFYKKRYSSNSYSIINHIARMYNVKIPLKVQGWINEHLASIHIKDGEMDGYSYTRGHKSTTIYKYINALIRVINAEAVSE